MINRPNSPSSSPSPDQPVSGPPASGWEGTLLHLMATGQPAPEPGPRQAFRRYASPELRALARAAIDEDAAKPA